MLRVLSSSNSCARGRVNPSSWLLMDARVSDDAQPLERGQALEMYAAILPSPRRTIALAGWQSRPSHIRITTPFESRRRLLCPLHKTESLQRGSEGGGARAGMGWAAYLRLLGLFVSSGSRSSCWAKAREGGKEGGRGDIRTEQKGPFEFEASRREGREGGREGEDNTNRTLVLEGLVHATSEKKVLTHMLHTQLIKPNFSRYQGFRCDLS